MRASGLLAVFLLALTPVLFTASSGFEDSKGEFDEVIRECENFQNREFILQRIRFGFDIDRLPDISFNRSLMKAKRALDLHKKLSAISNESLTHDEVVLKKTLMKSLQDFQIIHNSYWYQFPVAPYSTPIPTVIFLFHSFKFRDNSDLEKYLNLLKLVPGFLAQVQQKLIGQCKRNILIPRQGIERSVVWRDGGRPGGEFLA